MKKVYKKKFKDDFNRKPFGNKSMFLQQARQKMMAELAIEGRVMKEGITKEQASFRSKIWNGIAKVVSVIFCCLVCRAQVFPYVKPYFYKYKVKNTSVI